MTAEELGRLSEAIHEEARGLLDGHDRTAELDSTLRFGRAELDAGRGADALLDLVRSDEKLVSAALGPAQSKTFLERVAALLGGR